MTIKGNLIEIEKIKKKTERELAELSVLQLLLVHHGLVLRDTFAFLWILMKAKSLKIEFKILRFP